MKAMILAAGLGTRLKPWTLHHPKALVPVGGVPMLERVITKMKSSGFDYIVVNVHHFSDQITDFIRSKEFGIKIYISDESEKLMDTGGGIVHAAKLLQQDTSPFLIHNTDILSNADLSMLMGKHIKSSADATLLVSKRKSSRKLIIDNELCLKGWHNIDTGEYRPEHFRPAAGLKEVAFSGIHVMNVEMISRMTDIFRHKPFPVMDFYLNHSKENKFKVFPAENLQLIDIGKPETLKIAENLF